MVTLWFARLVGCGITKGREGEEEALAWENGVLGVLC